jgi:hypothetical protein
VNRPSCVACAVEILGTRVAFEQVKVETGVTAARVKVQNGAYLRYGESREIIDSDDFLGV